MLSPYVFAALYDPRIDVTKALHCGLIAFTEIPAMGSNTFTIFAETIKDTLGYVKPEKSNDDADCEKFYTQVLSMDNSPYTSYTFNLASLPTTNMKYCDLNGNASASCVSQVLIRYGSRVVRAMESKRGRSSLEILVDEGAIVGGIQFFLWFFGLYFIQEWLDFLRFHLFTDFYVTSPSRN